VGLAATLSEKDAEEPEGTWGFTPMDAVANMAALIT
jgi:hypothetical protein